MWMSLVGALLAVLSSTMVYGNVFYYALNFEAGHPARANPYLNVFVFGVNMDSICNDVGVLLVCGVLTSILKIIPVRPINVAGDQRSKNVTTASSEFSHLPNVSSLYAGSVRAT